MAREGASRTQRRSGTKTTVVPDANRPAQGCNAAEQKFRLGRYGRPGSG